MHNSILFLLLFIFALNTTAQDPHENGILVVESTFDDFDPGPLNTGGLTIIGVFDDIEGNNTPVAEIDLAGGTVNTWDESIGGNFDTPENSETVIWRFQYRIRVVETPYQAQVRLQINQDPWNGFNVERIIPAGMEEQWIYYDFLSGPFTNFNFDVLNFSLRFGAQQPQLMWLDDIRVYQSNAMQITSFEGTVDERFAVPFNTSLAFEKEANAPEGLSVMKAIVTDPGSSIGDAGVNLTRFVNATRYEGAIRLVVDVKVAEGPVELRAGFANTNALDDQLVYAQDTVTITQANQWTTASFLVQPIPFSAPRLFPFIQFGGQGTKEISFDRLTILKTDEVVDVPEVPVSVNEWALY